MYHGFTPPFTIASRAIFFFKMCIFLWSFRWWYSFFSQVIENRLKTMLFWRTLFFKKSKIFKKPRFWPFLRDFFEKIFLPSERSEKNTHFKKKDRPSSYSKKSFSEPIFRGGQAKNGFLHKKMYSSDAPSGNKWFFFRVKSMVCIFIWAFRVSFVEVDSITKLDPTWFKKTAL